MILDCFLLLVRIKPNILWMCRPSALRASTGVTKVTERRALPWKVFCLGRQKPRKNAHALASDELTWSSALLQRRPLLFLSVWLASVFGLAFFLFFWQGGEGGPFHLFFFGFFECLLFHRDSRFPPLIIKIWKLNFHSIFFFSNHLIKISSTTTKKIRSSCSK